MSNKLLNLPDGHRTRAYRAIVGILQADPVLKALDPTWRTLDGNANDKQDPSVDACPIIGLSPMPVPDETFTQETAIVHMMIGVELYVQGTCVDDLMNLWDSAIVPAVYLGKPFQDTTVYAYLRCQIPDISVSNFRVLRPAFGTWLPSNYKADDPLASLGYGLGTIAFDYERRR